MKKAERLKFIRTNFGERFVLPYEECFNEKDIVAAVDRFESEGFTWGLRTDLVDVNVQGYHLPFILRGTLDEALKVFRQHGNKLTYIASQNILNYLCNGVAIPHDEEHVFFEVNPVDNVSQRGMYDNPENLRNFFIGERRKILYNGRFYPGFKPEDNYVHDLKLSEIYSLIVGRKDIDEVTFSVRNPDKKIVIW